MTWTSEDIYAKDLQPGDRFTSRWAGDHTVALSEACTLLSAEPSSLGGIHLEVEMPSGDRAVRLVSAGNRVFRWISDEWSEEPRFTLTDEKDPDHPGILDAERPDRVAATGHSTGIVSAIVETWSDAMIENNLSWADLRTTGEPEVAAAVKGLGPTYLVTGGLTYQEETDESIEHFLPEALTTAILADRESTFDSFASAYAAEASEDSEAELDSEVAKVTHLAKRLGQRDKLNTEIAELRRDLSAMWGE